MKILFIRHGDPDYEHDSVTEKGAREIELLADRLEKLDITQFYCSPLGRAKKTAEATLRRLNREAIVYDWLREFPAQCVDEINGGTRLCWDFMPEYWTVRDDFFDKDKWLSDPVYANSDAPETYKAVCDGIDGILKDYGYTRRGNMYVTESSSDATIVIFCHLGVQFAMLSHLLNISPVLLWHGFFVAPSSVTTVCTEEREKGRVYFRCQNLGDISHLYKGGEQMSESGYFQKTYK